MLVKRENSIKKSEANGGVKNGVTVHLILTGEATWFLVIQWFKFAWKWPIGSFTKESQSYF